MIASVGASVGQWAPLVAAAPFVVSGVVGAFACRKYNAGRVASRQLEARRPDPNALLDPEGEWNWPPRIDERRAA